MKIMNPDKNDEYRMENDQNKCLQWYCSAKMLKVEWEMLDILKDSLEREDESFQHLHEINLKKIVIDVKKVEIEEGMK